MDPQGREDRTVEGLPHGIDQDRLLNLAPVID